MMTFQQSLEYGQAGESVISQWLQDRGCKVFPAYEKLIDTGKGPQLFTAQGNFVLPDLLVFGEGAKTIFWAEVKHKKRFSWHRMSQTWQTGIDLRHYRHYCEVQENTSLAVWLMFLHTSSEPSQSDLAHGAPKTCPSGLFGNALSDLMLVESHRSQMHGTSGMVYWPESALMKLAA
jgi:hypothetical protein